jgi:hypothetical protein
VYQAPFGVQGRVGLSDNVHLPSQGVTPQEMGGLALRFHLNQETAVLYFFGASNGPEDGPVDKEGQ